MKKKNDIEQELLKELGADDTHAKARLRDALTIELGREAAWQALAAKTVSKGADEQDNHRAPAPIIPLWRKTLRVAAVMLPFALMTIFLTQHTDTAERLAYAAGQEADTVALPDGSTVVLGEGSTLTYYADADGRHAELEGIGLFCVYHDEAAPFTVAAADARVRVLGTTFSVEHWPGQERVRTRVEQGRVAVNAKDAQTTLTAGQEAIWANGRMRKEASGVKKIEIGSHNMSFAGSTLRQVADELLTCYHKELKDVVFKCGTDSVVINTQFENQSLQSVIDELNMHFDKKIEIHNGYLTISD